MGTQNKTVEADRTLKTNHLEIVDETDIDEVIDGNKLMAYDIAVFYNTYNLSTLMKWWGKKLVLPDYQRSYVWNKKMASEFVDSVLRGLPVPTMFFYDDIDNSRLLVVDGQQRLTSLYRYIIEQEFNGKEFRLEGNIHPNWKGKTYSELEEDDRDRLDDALMNITVMRQLTPDDGQSSMYLAFQRINTGGLALKAQEIRMAVSYGPLSKLLDELSRDERFEHFQFLRTNNQRENGNYSKIQELILKFWAYYFSYPDYNGTSTRSLLDDFFSNQKNFDTPKKSLPGIKYHSEKEFREAYNAAIDAVLTLSEEDISPDKKPAQTFLEAIWVGLTYRRIVLKKDINKDGLREYVRAWKSSIGEDEFSRLFQARRTSSVLSAKERIEAGIDYFKGDF